MTTTTDKQEETMSGATTLTTPSDREIVTERVFDAPRDRVFEAFTDPQLIPRWWGPRRMTTIVDEMDVRPGGKWRFISHDCDDKEQCFRGIYREITPPERLVQTFEWEGMPGHVIVDTVIFEDLGGRTRLTTTSLFHTSEERDGMLSSGMESGLSESHERLAELLAETA
ncbi:MAG: SRPBCC family protein [Solirubrobacteraceae bacterium]